MDVNAKNKRWYRKKIKRYDSCSKLEHVILECDKYTRLNKDNVINNDLIGM